MEKLVFATNKDEKFLIESFDGWHMYTKPQIIIAKNEDHLSMFVMCEKCKLAMGWKYLHFEDDKKREQFTKHMIDIGWTLIDQYGGPICPNCSNTRAFESKYFFVTNHTPSPIHVQKKVVVERKFKLAITPSIDLYRKLKEDDSNHELDQLQKTTGASHVEFHLSFGQTCCGRKGIHHIYLENPKMPMHEIKERFGNKYSSTPVWVVVNH